MTEEEEEEKSTRLTLRETSVLPPLRFSRYCEGPTTPVTEQGAIGRQHASVYINPMLFRVIAVQ